MSQGMFAGLFQRSAPTLRVSTVEQASEAPVALIGGDLGTAMEANDQISHQTEDLSGLSHQMAAAAEEQHLATQEMAQNLERATR